MGEAASGASRRHWFGAAITAIAGLVTLQSIVHLRTVLDAGRIDTLVDLDRSNGVPDLVSTIALAAGMAGAFVLCARERGAARLLSGGATALLAALTVADLGHDGAHLHGRSGPLVIGLVISAVVLLALVALRSTLRARLTLCLAICLLGTSFLIAGLDRYDQWFERERGDPLREYEIVAKEGLELLGWSFVALALWNEARRKRHDSAGAPDGSTTDRRGGNAARYS